MTVVVRTVRNVWLAQHYLGCTCDPQRVPGRSAIKLLRLQMNYTNNTICVKGKGKEEYFYCAILVCHTHKVLRHGSHSFTCKLHHACLTFVSIHQTAPPQTEVADIELQLTTHLSTPKGWKAELAWLAGLLRTVYPHKWSSISYRSSAEQGSSPAKNRRSTAVPH